MLLFEGGKRVEVRLGQVLEHTEDQHRVRLGDGDLDLRHHVAPDHAREQIREGFDEVSDWRGQDLAARQRGHIGLLPLPETHQHTTALRDELRTQPRATAIGPDRPLQRFEPAQRLDPADARDVFCDFFLFRRQLCVRRHVLQGATPADTEMGTGRHHPIRRRFQHFEELALVVLAVMADAGKADGLARQRTRHEHGLGIADHARAVMVERDHRPGLGHRRGLHASATGRPGIVHVSFSAARRRPPPGSRRW